MAKLISTKPHRANQSVSIAIVGTVTFDKDCTVEIPEDKGVLLKEYLKDKESIGYKVVLDNEPVEKEKKTTAAKAEKSKAAAKPAETAPPAGDDDHEEEEEEENENGGGEEDENEDDDANNGGDGSNSELIASLQNMEKEELQKMAKDSNFPEEEWIKKNTKALKKYLAEKLA